MTAKVDRSPVRLDRDAEDCRHGCSVPHWVQLLPADDWWVIYDVDGQGVADRLLCWGLDCRGRIEALDTDPTVPSMVEPADDLGNFVQLVRSVGPPKPSQVAEIMQSYVERRAAVEMRKTGGK